MKHKICFQFSWFYQRLYAFCSCYRMNKSVMRMMLALMLLTQLSQMKPHMLQCLESMYSVLDIQCLFNPLPHGTVANFGQFMGGLNR